MPLSQLFPAWRAEQVLHEDSDLIVVDKPAGISTHAPDPGREDDAWSRVSLFLRERGDRDPYLGIHQRLDRDTSGVLLFTRRKEANKGIAAEFEGRHVKKTYVAAVTGLRGPDRGVLHHKLIPGRDGAMRALSATAREGLEAITRYRVLERSATWSLLELSPETGRTHQLRIQLAAFGAPIGGDPLYGGQAAPRLLLHATELTLKHPSSGVPMTFRSPMPAVFRQWIRAGAITLPEDRASLEARFREAADGRYALARLADTTAYRLVNGAGDGMPGIDVDRYGEHLVVSLSSDDAVRAKDDVLDAAFALGAEGVYLKMRPKHASVIVDARREEFAPRAPARGTPAPDELTIREHGLSYKVRLGDGLSTGIFLDQRENRRRVRELAKDARVLNLFAYTGAFTVAAAAGGARSSVTVDVSPGAIAWARQNLEAAGADMGRHALLDVDVLPWLERVAPGEEPFDLILLDPPSYATTKHSRFSAEDDYKKLATLALRVLAPDGRLLACTNHRGIVRAKFRRFLHEAARDARRNVVQMKDLPDPEDYPPEPGREVHLKSVLVRISPAPRRDDD